ncbi:MAG: hypothetical protein Q9168_006769 [Polycauliona sp. 1 TL-2023]
MSSLYQSLIDDDSIMKASTDRAQRSLRLLTLVPGIPGSRIVCQLDKSTLCQCRGEYEALSYVWGEATLTHMIFINGHHVSVTQNLVQCLHQIRHVSKPRRLWIDALCINQKDIQERNDQVKLMGAIYKNASRVLVFLGIEAEHSADAMSLLIPIGRLAQEDHDGLEALLKDDALTTSWQGLQRLFRRPWWGRAWIVQEYAVARDAVFLCGIQEIDGSLFARALENLVDYRFKAIVPQQHEYLIRHVASTPIHHLWSTRCRYQDNTRPDDLHAMDVLYKFRGSQSFDARDKLFSILSLIKHDSLLAPDYTKSTAHVYKAIVKEAIQTSGTLEILTHHNQSVVSMLNLPTWCPDWTIMRGKRILLWPNGYNAAGSLKRTVVHFSNDSLTLRGVELDRIRYLKPFESDDFKSRPFIRHELHKFAQLACQAPYTESSVEHRLDSIHRTLVAARIRPGGPQREATALRAGQACHMWNAWSKQADEAKPSKQYEQCVERYTQGLYSALCGRSILLTDSGHVGLVDGSAQIGDRIYVFSGGQVPFCIRSSTHPGDQGHKLVGEW